MSEGASRWEIRHTGKRQFHPVLVAGNGEDVVWGETYTTRRKAREAVVVAAILGPAAWRDGRVRDVEAVGGGEGE